jgi:integrase
MHFAEWESPPPSTVLQSHSSRASSRPGRAWFLHDGRCGSPAIRRPKPLVKLFPLILVLSHLSQNCASAACTMAHNWVFPNRAGRPREQQNVLQRHLRPAAMRAGIGKIGWHTFRHSYSTMLRAAGVDIKVQQELLRHSTIQSPMNIYTQAVSEQKRAANSMVVGILLNENCPGKPSPR